MVDFNADYDFSSLYRLKYYQGTLNVKYWTGHVMPISDLRMVWVYRLQKVISYHYILIIFWNVSTPNRLITREGSSQILCVIL